MQTNPAGIARIRSTMRATRVSPDEELVTMARVSMNGAGVAFGSDDRQRDQGRGAGLGDLMNHSVKERHRQPLSNSSTQRLWYSRTSLRWDLSAK